MTSVGNALMTALVAGKVSILIPVYNRAHCIEQTLACALDQTWQDIEVVVVDNASTDTTWELVQGIAARDVRVRAFRNDSNIGPVRNWLRCVHEATGIYGKILWSDDLLHPDFLVQALPSMANPDVGFVYSPVRVFSGNDPLTGQLFYGTPPAGTIASLTFIEGLLLGGDYPVSPGCALFRLCDMRDCLLEQVPNRVGSDFSQHAIGNDALLFLLVAARYEKVVMLTEPLAYFRAHPGSITVSSTPEKVVFNYAIAEAYFVSQSKHVLPTELVARFNAVLWLYLLRFRSNAQKLRHVADFYPEPAAWPLDRIYLLRRLVNMVLRRAQRIMRSV